MDMPLSKKRGEFNMEKLSTQYVFLNGILEHKNTSISLITNSPFKTKQCSLESKQHDV